MVNYKKFVELTCRLSPENLYCDGEISRAEVSRRYHRIIKEWQEAEEKEGRVVTQEEVEGIMIKEVNQ